MNYNNLCYNCFAEKNTNTDVCPKCGFKASKAVNNASCLMPGTLLKNRYIVGKTLGVGGFGITYKCLDSQIGAVCAIKEYFPANMAIRNGSTKYIAINPQNLERYNRIMKRFVEEAQLVKKLKHQNVITIHDNFFENNTAYYVMEYCDGIDLRKYTNNFTKKLNYEEGMNILYQTLNGLEYVHSKGILHRDIAPDNIYITKGNIVKILDFGAARSEMEQSNRALSVIVKMGYAPIEQYGNRSKQGAYTDIYALGATFYHLFTGIVPMESTQRVAEDTMPPFSRLRPDLPDNLKYSIERAMALTIANRIRDVAEMKRILGLDNNSLRINERKTQTQQGKNTGQARMSHYPNKVAELDMRMGAYVVDMFFWAIGYILLSFLISAPTLMLYLFPVAVAVGNSILEMIWGKTLGKAMLGMYVYTTRQQQPQVGEILARNFIKALGVFVLVFSKEGRLLQDRATDTIVCRK